MAIQTAVSANVEAPASSASGATPVQQVMTGNVRTAQPEDSIQDVARMMKEAGCGFIPITQDGRLSGVITDRDIVVRGVAVGPRETAGARVWEIMTPTVLAVSASDTLDHAAGVMAKHQVRRLPVLDQGRVVGVLSHGDLVQALRGEGAAAFATVGVTMAT